MVHQELIRWWGLRKRLCFLMNLKCVGVVGGCLGFSVIQNFNWSVEEEDGDNVLIFYNDSITVASATNWSTEICSGLKLKSSCSRISMGNSMLFNELRNVLRRC